MAGYEHESAFDEGYLPVSDLHTMHYEQYGRPDGKPVLYLHGGPGGSTSKFDTSFFDPHVYRVVLYDQRGAGQSTPSAELRDNTTIHLVGDIEMLRAHLDVRRWHVVFGGSWGATLALAYAQTHPERIAAALVLRGVALFRDEEVAWARPWRRGEGVSRLFPDAYDELLGHLAPADRADWVEAYYRLLTAEDRAVRLAAARQVNRWDLIRGRVLVEPGVLEEKIDDDKWSLEHACIEMHYVKHRAWMEDGQVLREENMAKIRHIPATIVQGRYDAVCPPITAWDLHRAWPGSKLVMVPGAGHSAKEPGIFRELVKACDEYAASSC